MSRVPSAVCTRSRARVVDSRRDVGVRLRRVADRIDDQERVVERFLEAEETAQLVVVRVHHCPGLALDERLEIGAEVDRHAVREGAVAEHADAERFTDPAVRAVCGHEVFRPHRAGRAAVAIAQGGPHARSVLLEGNDLGREAKPRAERLRALLEDRLECSLRQERAQARAGLAHSRVEVGDVVFRDAADERLDREHAAVLHELLFRALHDGVLDAELTEDLHRPLARLRSAWMDRGAAVILRGE